MQTTSIANSLQKSSRKRRPYKTHSWKDKRSTSLENQIVASKTKPINTLEVKDKFGTKEDMKDFEPSTLGLAIVDKNYELLEASLKAYISQVMELIELPKNLKQYLNLREKTVKIAIH